MGILDQELAEFAKSDKFKQLAKQSLNESVKNKDPKGSMMLARSIEENVFYIKKILSSKMIENGLGAYIDIEHEVVPTNETIDGNPCVEINLVFGPGSFSPSLNPTNDKPGVMLPRLLNTGFKTSSRPPSGIWISKTKGMPYGKTGVVYNKPIIGLNQREGLHFIESACQEFNSYAAGTAIATYIRRDPEDFS